MAVSQGFGTEGAEVCIDRGHGGHVFGDMVDTCQSLERSFALDLMSREAIL